MKILVTGASGFVGRAVCRRMLDLGWSVRGGVRRIDAILPNGAEKVLVGEITGETDWSDALQGIDVVIHLAARVHVMQEKSSDPLAEFRKVNVEGTLRLAEDAAKAGVKRLVYVSSIKVNGEATFDRPFSESDEPNPQDPYGISKHEAEMALQKISAETGLEVVIVRPPLVYGPGVGGNFARMLGWIEKGIPLPLGSVRNRRSMIYVENLADALIHCATRPEAANETFLVSDAETVSTPELVRILSEKMGVKPAIFPLPLALLAMLGKLAGKSAEIERLTGSLEIDSSGIREKLGWQPQFDLDKGLSDTARRFNSEHNPAAN